MEIVHLGTRMEVTLGVSEGGEITHPLVHPFILANLSPEAFLELQRQISDRRAEMLAAAAGGRGEGAAAEEVTPAPISATADLPVAGGDGDTSP